MIDAKRGEDFRRRAVACLDGLYTFAVSLSRDRALAEDLVQETYLRAFQARRRPEPLEGVRPWLFTILHNLWRNQRRRGTMASLDDDTAGALPSVEPDPAEGLSRAEDAARLRAAIEALPHAFREVVVLRFGEGFSYREIAEVLACPAGTVMSRLARARCLLRASLAAGPEPKP